MEKDPVCGMELKIEDENLEVVFNKKTYYFCSNQCKLQFLRNPEKYVRKESWSEYKHQH